MQSVYKRILLKLSGESLMGDKSFGLDPAVIGKYAAEVKSIVDIGVQVAIVIGGGNIYRGMNQSETGIERAHGDYNYVCVGDGTWELSKNPTKYGV